MKNKFLISLIIFTFASSIVFPLTDNEKELFEAVKTTNIQKINDVLKITNLNINVKDDEGYTPLLRAVYYNSKSSLIALLQVKTIDKEAKLSTPTELDGWYLDGATAVMLASFFGYNELLTLLVDNGCLLDARDSLDGALPIHIAAANGHLDTVKKIVSYNKNYVNAKTADNSTALMWAAMKDKNDVVAYLIEISELEARDIEDWSALHYASAFSSPATVETLIEGKADINALEKDGNTALDIAKNDEIKKVLLANGAKTSKEIYAINNSDGTPSNEEENEETPPIDLVYVEDNSEYADSLEYKNLTSSQIQLLLNIKQGDVLAINKYIQNSTDVNFTNESGFTPIVFAIVNERTDTLAALLESTNINKDSVFAKNAEYDGWYLEGATPLILAAYLGQADMVDLLIQNGANIFHKDSVDGAMAIHAAAANGALDVLVSIITFNEDVINATDNTGFTPLHWAVMYSHEDVVKELLDNGANPNIADDNKEFPIHLAAANGDNNIVEMLLAKGSDVNAIDKDGNTPLHFATYSSYGSVLKTLIKYNANKNLTNNEGKKAIEIAIDNEDTDIIKILNRRDRGNSKWWVLD